MANTTTPAALELQKWRRKFWREFVRDSGFKPYMGNSPMSVIHTLMELTTGGKTITIPLVGRLSGSGVSGTSTLTGNEEALGQYGHDITVAYRRHAVAIDKQNMQYSAADQLEVVRPLLKEWCMDRLRNDIITQLHTINGTAYGSASEGVKDAWLVDNNDRVVFGSAAPGLTDHSADLALLDATNDLMKASVVSLAKRKAKTADPHIRPVRTGTSGREYYVHFMGPRAFRDLKNDSTMAQANREARPRDVESNPIFQDGDLIYDGVICREIPEIAALANVGAGGTTDVEPSFLCGAQAIGVAYGQMPMPTTKKEDDYGFVKGRGIEECLGVSKIVRDDGSDPVDHGVVTVYVAAPADS